MKYRVIVAGVLAVAIAVPLQAQTSSCASGSTQDVCQKAVDMLNFMTPQLSTALASGNPTLGQGGTLGGFGHFSIDLRGSAVNGSLPQLSGVGLSPVAAQHSTFTSKNQLIPMVSADAGIGLWRGISLGVTHVGGIDALVTMTYLPNISNSGSADQANFKVQGSNEKFGYGARLGLLEESAVTPGVSFAWVQRNLPAITASATVDPAGLNPGGTIALQDFTVKTSDWRLTAGKSFLIFGVSLGVGQDKYNANSTIAASINTNPTPSLTPSAFSMTRTNMFVGAYVNLFVFKLEGEFGQVSGGSVPAAFNTFGTDAAKSRSYFTLGLRFGR
jgi:FlaG/FlaF family flagellin (archaellin)